MSEREGAVVLSVTIDQQDVERLLRERAMEVLKRHFAAPDGYRTEAGMGWKALEGEVITMIEARAVDAMLQAAIDKQIQGVLEDIVGRKLRAVINAHIEKMKKSGQLARVVKESLDQQSLGFTEERKD